MDALKPRYHYHVERLYPLIESFLPFMSTFFIFYLKYLLTYLLLTLCSVSKNEKKLTVSLSYTSRQSLQVFGILSVLQLSFPKDQTLL